MSSAWDSPHGVYVVAEIGLNHNGKIEQALQLVDVAVEAGADAVKFQKRDVPSLATGDVLDAADLRFPSMGSTYREIRETHELSFSELELLKDYAASRNVDFFVTPFDIPSLEFLDRLGVDRFKVASHSVTNIPLLKEIGSRGKPVLLSSGMCSIEELDTAVRIFANLDIDLALLHCVSSYPTLPEDTRLDLIQTFLGRYGVRVGYSGHEIGFEPTLFAIAAGARLVERHITLDNDAEGFDHRLSLNPSDFRLLVSRIREIMHMFPGGPKVVTEKEKLTRDKYQVSMVSNGKIPKGEVLSKDKVIFKNPGTGIPPGRMHELVGRIARIDIPDDTLLSPDHFE